MERLDLITRRPPTVDMRFRNPCLLALRLLFGLLNILSFIKPLDSIYILVVSQSFFHFFGMGFTDLLGLHYWFKRIGVNRQILGSPELVREEAAKIQMH